MPSGSNRFSRSWLFGAVAPRIGLQTLTLREEKRLQVFENEVLRKIFGPKRDDQTGEWRILHNDQLQDLYGK